MKSFFELFNALDSSNKTTDKLEALKAYFSSATEENKLWALALFTGKRPKRAVNSRQLREWAAELAGIPEWLLEESYQVVGDLAETVALLVPSARESNLSNDLSALMLELADWKDKEEAYRKTRLFRLWQGMDRQERFVFTKLITGGFRVGVSENLVRRAIAAVENIPQEKLAHRLMGNWSPQSTTYKALIGEERKNEDAGIPYPFCLAHPLDHDPEKLGDPEHWLVEWKWDGIRGQLIKRGDEIHIWSRGGEPIADQFPELIEAAREWPFDLVMDGEILAYKESEIANFGELQTRIGRKKPGSKLLKSNPVLFMAYDLPEWQGKDIREEPLEKRRKIMKELPWSDMAPMRMSPSLEQPTWEAYAALREKSREYQAEGFMLKLLRSPYHTGRKRGDWWKWKTDPYTIDGVLIYAQKGHGRRANLYTDFTLGVWDQDKLVPFAKAYSGLTDKELREVDAFIKKNTLERFGPVRTVTPALVFEIGFEGIRSSNRHKSGVALRFPRILRWRKDKTTNDANHLEDLKSFL
jgi:DNA ligase-1